MKISLIPIFVMLFTGTEVLADMNTCTELVNNYGTKMSTEDQVCRNINEVKNILLPKIMRECRGVFTITELNNIQAEVDNFDMDKYCSGKFNDTKSGGTTGSSHSRKGGATANDGNISGSDRLIAAHKDDLDNMESLLSNDPPKKDKNSSKSKPLDPSVNYNGQSCRYFTREHDDAHINSYADGTHRLYGDNYYVCKDGHWKYLHKRNVLTPKQIKATDAVLLE